MPLTLCGNDAHFKVNGWMRERTQADARTPCLIRFLFGKNIPIPTLQPQLPPGSL
jgi:hypothetical protein